MRLRSNKPITASAMTMSVLQGRSPTASLFKCDFSYSCAAFDKMSADIVSRAGI